MDFDRVNFRSPGTVILFFILCGMLCSGVTSNCSSAPCQNGATCTDTTDGYSCTCPQDPLEYTGRNCELLYDTCSQTTCPDNETCVNTPGIRGHKCTCRPGAPGANCSADTNECVCPKPNSECIPGPNGSICQCQSGFSSEKCLVETLLCSSSPCQNNGTCEETAGRLTCACVPGFRGTHCEENIDECASNPCQNEAICMDRVNKYSCFCVPGYQGNRCEIDINECASRPCKNNGTCLNEKDHYECECTLGYTGTNCEIEIDECESNPCQNNATCNDHVGSYVCSCTPGYEGVHCEVDINECESQPCVNGGQCIDHVNRYECDCSDTGFTGDKCEHDIPECASDPCQNNATCLEGVKNYSCACWPGYIGYHCETDVDECAANPCQNGAFCLERSNQTHYRRLPEFNQEFTYIRAAGYICRCQPGFTGENCSVNIDECESQPCQNGGRCEDEINRFRCHCALGYTGVECALNIDDCEREPCQNGGRCVDGVADYTCQCLPEDTKGVLWGGENCSVRLTGCQLHFCQNEATCIPTYEGGTHGYLCQCRAGFYDELCSTATTFSFTSNGYVIYDFSSVNRTKRETTNGEFNVSLRFRTTLPDLLIFYQGGEADFLFLEVYKGLLHVMMRSNDTETHLLMNETMVADGQWHQVEVSLEEVMRLTLGHEDCSNGSCTKYHPVNSDWSLSDSSSRMYIGGLNEGSLLSNTRSQQNFTGCMEDLRINSRTILPTDLTSDISYQMNLGCSKTEWCQPNPCFNAGRCIDLWTSFRCDCIRPYEGTTCLQEYVAGTFNFEGSPSLASFTIDENLGTSYDFSVFLQTMKPSGLLIQVGNYTTTCLNVYLQDGRINIATSPGNNVTFPENLADGATHMITLHFKDGEVAMTYQSKRLNLGQMAPVALEPGYQVYVGGHPFEERIDFWGGYFKGCLQDLRLNDYRLEFFPLQMDNYSHPQEGFVGKMRNITESCVSDDTCGSNPCKNGGNCTVTWNDFDCYCTSNFTGKTCEELVWCESLPCPIGTECQNLPGGYMCLANATFQGSSALEYTPKTTIEKDLTAISLDFRTRDMDAILFHATRGVDSVQILIENFLLLVNILSGNSIEGVTFRSETPVSDATWHHLFLSMEDPLAFSSNWIADLDNLGNVTLQGSAGNLNFMQDKVSIVLAENFTGCLGRVSIGGIYLPYIEAQTFPQRDQFVRSSVRTVPLGCRGLDVCSKSPCLHKGECQDLFNSFSCACTPAWEGPRCQSNVDDCKSNPCIHGKCIDLEADYRCMCFPGYTGRSCETNVNDCQHHRCLNGGTCIDGINTYSCKCTSTYAGNHCQWPHPPDQCDKNFTCLNEGTCTSGIWGANCTCKAGFTGRNCEIDINECDSNPCLNGGTCQDSINMYKCLCNGSFTGGQCEKGIPVGFLTFPLLGVAVPVACGCLLLLFIGVLFMVFTARKRRQSEGTYSPSQQEVAGARLEMDNVMKMPPEERLI